MTLAELNARMLEERIANCSAAQIDTRTRIIEACQAIITKTGWALDPEESHPAYWASNLLEQAHELVDLAHAFKQANERKIP